MGSPDIDKWLREARDSTISFFKDHVEQPVYSFFLKFPVDALSFEVFFFFFVMDIGP